MATKKCLEGLVNEAIIQEFTGKEAVVQQQVEVARAKIEVFEIDLPKSE
jgi:hypothetical protein